MAGKFKIKKLQINLTNRWLYTLIVFFSLVVIGVGVYAAVGTTPNPGHPITELQPCNTAGEILKSDGTTWTCGTDEVGGNGGTSLWSLSGSNIYYNNGNVGIGTSSPQEKLHVAGNIQAASYAFISSVYSGTDTVLGYNVKKDINDGDRLNVVSGASTVHPQAIILGPGEGIRFLTSSSNPGAGADWLLNSYEKMRIEPSGDVGIGTTSPAYELDVNGYVNANGFIGDGTRLVNLVVRVQGIDDICDSTNDGLLRYRSSYCVDQETRTSSFSICMRTADSIYQWYTLKSYTWSDPDCTCPTGTRYFECTGDYVEPGCYASRPVNCYRFIRPER